jgi:hypothetical protein
MSMDQQAANHDDHWSSGWSAFWSGCIAFVICFFWIAVAQVVTIAVLFALNPPGPLSELSDAQIEAVLMDGDGIGIAFLLALPLVFLTLLSVVRLRRRQPVVDYLGLRPAAMKEMARWFGYLLILGVISITLERILDRPPIPQWMLTAYATTDHVWLLFAGITVLAPVTEELLYRGYILKVWSRTWLGTTGSVVLVSLLWAGSHLQYDLYDMGWIVLFGILLGMSRLKTGSAVPAIIMHMGMNAVSFFLMTATQAP